MTEPTIFHKILSRELPATIFFEDEETLAFKDIYPKAPTHVLFIPKTFIVSVADVTPETAHIPGMLILKAQRFAKEQGIAHYKLLFNVGKDAGQMIPYIHLHFMTDLPLKTEGEFRPAKS